MHTTNLWEQMEKIQKLVEIRISFHSIFIHLNLCLKIVKLDDITVDCSIRVFVFPKKTIISQRISKF